MLELSRTENVIVWVCRLLAAGILLQTLYFKFTGAPESVYIFTKVGMEPWGRLGSGVAELIAASLLFVPGLTWLGAGMSLAIMGGAILSHLTVLGIEVQGDGGLLFGLALVVAAASFVLLYLHKTQLPLIGQLLAR
ncbi:MAG TPA: hypothetical protein VK970_09260 [Candidatus Methylacidiphilales bacterium]|nr:hypothetical protein [Candidatus Methylacidiphilales bacterium]